MVMLSVQNISMDRHTKNGIKGDSPRNISQGKRRVFLSWKKGTMQVFFFACCEILHKGVICLAIDLKK